MIYEGNKFGGIHSAVSPPFSSSKKQTNLHHKVHLWREKRRSTRALHLWVMICQLLQIAVPPRQGWTPDCESVVLCNGPTRQDFSGLCISTSSRVVQFGNFCARTYDLAWTHAHHARAERKELAQWENCSTVPMQASVGNTLHLTRLITEEILLVSVTPPGDSLSQ